MYCICNLPSCSRSQELSQGSRTRRFISRYFALLTINHKHYQSKKKLNNGGVTYPSLQNLHPRSTPLNNINAKPPRPSGQMAPLYIRPCIRHGTHWRHHPSNQVRAQHDRLETVGLASSHDDRRVGSGV